MQRTAGLFEGAREFVVSDASFYNVRTTDDSHTIEGAEFDSSKRYPPPQCHPGTRKSIIERMRSWLRNPCRTKRMLWLVGSAGVGKSAIMQTLAELEAESLLLVTLFFSAPNGRNDPTKVIITLAYRIAVRKGPVPRGRYAFLGNVTSHEIRIGSSQRDHTTFSYFTHPPQPSSLNVIPHSQEDHTKPTNRAVTLEETLFGATRLRPLLGLTPWPISKSLPL